MHSHHGVHAPPSWEDRCWDSAFTAGGAEAPRREKGPPDPNKDSGQVCRTLSAELGAPGSADPSGPEAPPTQHRPWGGGSRSCSVPHPSQRRGELRPIVCVTPGLRDEEGRTDREGARGCQPRLPVDGPMRWPLPPGPPGPPLWFAGKVWPPGLSHLPRSASALMGPGNPVRLKRTK